MRVEPTMINGTPGWRSWDGDRVSGCLQLVITDGVIEQVLIMVNPDKLAGLGAPRPLAR